jgi:hypothetical protein
MKLTKSKLKQIIKEEIQLLTEATRWNVGIELPNGKVLAVYGHLDGYPDGVGKMLKKHYSNPAKIKQLLKVGKQGISSLGKDIGKKHDFNLPYDEKNKLGYTTFYGRDRGEKGNMSATYKDKQEYGKKFGNEFGYVYSMKDKKWTYFDYHGNEKEL